MTIIDCPVEDCGWVSQDLPDGFAGVLAIALKGHIDTAHVAPHTPWITVERPTLQSRINGDDWQTKGFSSKSGQAEANKIQKEVTDLKEAFTTKEQELEQLKKDSEDKTYQLNKLKSNNVQLKKIGRNFREKLTMAETENSKINEEKSTLDAAIHALKDENKKLKHNHVQLKKIGRKFREKLNLVEIENHKITEEKTTLDAAIQALTYEKKKLKEDNEKLMSSNLGENVGASDASWRAGDADGSMQEAEALIAQSAAEIEIMTTELDEIKAENDALKTKMAEKEEIAKKVLKCAKTKIQKVELEYKELQQKFRPPPPNLYFPQGETFPKDQSMGGGQGGYADTYEGYGGAGYGGGFGRGGWGGGPGGGGGGLGY